MTRSLLGTSWKVLICVLVLISTLAIPSARCEAAEDEPLMLGLGYQGILLPEIMNAASVRAWLNNQFALEANIYHAYLDAEVTEGDTMDVNFFAFSLKGLFATIVKDNSKFYVGAEGGYGIADLDADTDTLGTEMDTEIETWMIGPLVGAEYSFTELPELGFNWELGYKFNFMDVEDVELDLFGLYVSVGVHYYF